MSLFEILTVTFFVSWRDPCLRTSKNGPSERHSIVGLYSKIGVAPFARPPHQYPGLRKFQFLRLSKECRTALELS